jgi:hypothetical protein
MYVTIEQTNPLLGQERLDRPSFDSYLLPPATGGDGNAELILCLRLRFVPATPGMVGRSSPDGAGHERGAWDVSSWADYKRRALESANRAWNGRLWLVTPPGYAELDYPAGPAQARPAVKCSLRVVEADTRGTAHARINVVRRNGAPAAGFRPHLTLWDSGDVCPADLPPGEAEGRATRGWMAPHGVGHLLGLPAVGARAADGGRCLACAALGRQEDGDAAPASATGLAHNVMGGGSVVQGINAAPWINRMVLHTEGNTSPQDWAAVVVKIGPRLLPR